MTTATNYTCLFNDRDYHYFCETHGTTLNCPIHPGAKNIVRHATAISWLNSTQGLRTAAWMHLNTISSVTITTNQ